MLRSLLRTLLVAALAILPAAPLLAGGVNLSQFPLRVHIYNRSEHSHYSYHVLDWVEGEGRANLFENGTVRGFDFGFRCGERIMTSSGFETYPARWKKPGRVLEILYPVMGKPDAKNSCELKVDMKDTAYVSRNGGLTEEPSAEFKRWMDRHQYDPEHGKDLPVTPDQAVAPPTPSPTNNQ